MTLLAGFQTFLQRYTGQNDLLVGTPVANRTRVELENLLGCFVNTLVLRVNVSDDPSFRELLGRAREVCVGAYSHQDLPFEKIVEELQPERALSRSPLVQVMFQLKNVPERSVSLPAIEFDEMEFDHEVAKFDLTLSMVDRGSTIAVTMVYDTDLFDHGTMERMLGHLQILLEGIVADPEQRISELPLLTESERHQLLVEWNDTKTEYPRDKCIHELFEQQAEETPDAVAVVFEDQQLSYRQLNERANRLARYLQRQGVGADVRVGICMARSLDLIVGLLGIVKSGGAYVPLDINYPQERLEFVLADAQVAVLLTQEDLFEAEGLRKAGSERQFPRFDPRIPARMPGPGLAVDRQGERRQPQKYH